MTPNELYYGQKSKVDPVRSLAKRKHTSICWKVKTFDKVSYFFAKIDQKYFSSDLHLQAKTLIQVTGIIPHII